VGRSQEVKIRIKTEDECVRRSIVKMWLYSFFFLAAPVAYENSHSGD